MVSITIDRITKRFGAQTALDGVSLHIEAGAIYFLLGPSGCGKTTLLRTIAGFVQPDEGRILFGSDDITSLPAHKRRLAMMFQSYALWPHLTAEKNVSFGLEELKVPAPERAERVHQALAAVHMEHLGSRRIAELSGGQQQRIALARALVVRPRALLLDEPLSNLDAKLRIEMRSEIRRVCREFGLTAIYVTHDQKEALSIADRLAILDQGRVIQEGTPEEVYRRPRSRTVADFIGETNFIEGRVTENSGPHIMVETAIGLFQGVASGHASDVSPGSAVILSIRPESWLIGTAADGTNSLRGHITSSLYLGEIAQYEIAVGSLTLKAFELNPRARKPAGPAAVSLSVAPDDVVVLPR